MKQFSLNEYFKDVNQKVVTREGRQVRIVCTDAPVKNYPVTGYVLGNDNKWLGPFSWSKDGERQIAHPIPSENDLFFSDKEENMTEFEKEVSAIMDVEAKRALGIKYEAKYLLDLARKQLQPEIDAMVKEKYRDYIEQFKEAMEE